MVDFLNLKNYQFFNEIFIKNVYILQGGKANLIMIEFKIENILFSAKLAEKIDAQFLSKNFTNSKYNPDEYSGIIINLDNPKCVGFLSPLGEMFCTGLKNIDDIENVINKIIDDIENLNISIFDDIHIEIESIIASYDFNKNIDLDYIKTHIEFENIEYHLDNIPYLQMTLPNSKIILILFENGKLLINSAKEISEITNEIRFLKEKFVDSGIIL